MKKITITEGTDLNNIINAFQNGEIEEQELTFNPNIYNYLPDIIKPIFDIIKNDQKMDIALLTILTVFSGILKNYKTHYAYKEEGCQLFTYLLGNPSQGKGFAEKFREVGILRHRYLLAELKRKLEKEQSATEDDKDKVKERPKSKRLFLSSNLTKAVFSVELFDNDGYGTFFIVEADTLVSANKSDFGSFSDLLRLGFHGEPYSLNRIYFNGKPIDIDGVYLSVFLTSTLNQCFKMLPNYEDGLFSRFMYYFVKGNNDFDQVFIKNKTMQLDSAIKVVSKKFDSIGFIDSKKEVTFFEFTAKQEQLFFEHFKRSKEKMVSLTDEKLGANINRLGVSITRICMLLTYLRNYSTKQFNNSTFTCSDTDFYIGMAISVTLQKHLKLLDYNYKKQNKNITNQISIQFPINNKNNNKIIRCLSLRQKGLSYREIAHQVLGNSKLQGTVSKWCSKNKTMPFPFPETETSPQNVVNPKDLLKMAKVSFFKNATSAKPISNEFNLYSLLTKGAFAEDVNNVRNCNSIVEKKKLKKRLHAFTVSGLFDPIRSKDSLAKHSGLICIDIDRKGNEEVENFDSLAEQLSNIVNVAYCGKSVSGNGYFLIIPISNPEKHEAYFDALEEAFNELGITVDKCCKDVARLRFVSHDDNYYIPETVVLFDSVLSQVDSTIPLPIDGDYASNDLSSLLKALEYSEIDITSNYEDWFAIGCALSDTFKKDGLKYYHKISKYYRGYSPSETDKQFKICLERSPRKNGYTISTLYFIAIKYGVKW